MYEFVEVWEVDGIKYDIKKVYMPGWDMMPDSTKELLNEWWYCGYATFPEEYDLDKIDLLEIDVHGGVTYHSGQTIGFDCNHYDDKDNPLTKSISWVKEQCYSMSNWVTNNYK